MVENVERHGTVTPTRNTRILVGYHSRYPIHLLYEPFASVVIESVVYTIPDRQPTRVLEFVGS